MNVPITVWTHAILIQRLVQMYRVITSAAVFLVWSTLMSALSQVVKVTSTAKRTKLSIKDIFSKCDQIHWLLRIWSHSLKKSLTENFLYSSQCFSKNIDYLKTSKAKLLILNLHFSFRQFCLFCIIAYSSWKLVLSKKLVKIWNDKVKKLSTKVETKKSVTTVSFLNNCTL